MNREKFYKTKEWFACKNSYIKKVDFICERCGRAAYSKADKRYKEGIKNGQDVLFGIVHHKIHLNDVNINDPYITLSHANLEYLCINCHNKEHMSVNRIREGVKFDDNGGVIM